MALMAIAICWILQETQGKGYPELASRYQVQPLGEMVLVEGRQRLAEGARLVTIEIDAGTPCNDLEDKIYDSLTANPNSKLTDTDIARFTNRTQVTCEKMIQEAIFKPMRRLCDTIEKNAQRDTISPRFLPLIPLWFIGSAATSVVAAVVAAGAAYAGALLSAKDINDRLETATKVLKTQFEGIHDSNLNESQRLSDVQAIVRALLNNQFHLVETFNIIVDATEYVKFKKRLPYRFMRHFRVNQPISLAEQVLSGCQRSDARGKPQWYVSFSIPRLSSKRLYHARFIETQDERQCVNEYSGPKALILDSRTDQNCWADVADSEMLEDTILVPKCTRRHLKYSETRRANCDRNATSEQLQARFATKDGIVVYCLQQIHMGDQWYQCPATPVLIKKEQVLGRAFPQITLPGAQENERVPDYRSADIKFNVEEIPGLFEQPAEIPTVPPVIIPPANATETSKGFLGTLKSWFPDWGSRILGVIISFTLVRWIIAQWKFIRVIMYMMPFLGGRLLWYKMRKDARKPTPVAVTVEALPPRAVAPTAPPPPTQQETSFEQRL